MPDTNDNIPNGGNRTDIHKRVGLAAEVFGKYGDEILETICFNVDDQSMANDIFQDFFISLVRKPIPQNIKDVRGYLYKVVINDVIDFLHQTSITKEIPKDAVVPVVRTIDPTSRIPEKESQDIIPAIRTIDLTSRIPKKDSQDIIIPVVRTIDLTPHLLQLLKEDPEKLRSLSPSGFERFIAGRLDAMGFDVTLTGQTHQSDGGIDLIAVPKVRTVGSTLMAGQVKHHRNNRKTGRAAVDRLLAWRNGDFNLGLLVTNTGFTSHARWLAMQDVNRSFLRLRDFDDLKKWLKGNYTSKGEWREIPESVVLTPDLTIEIPRPRITWDTSE
jgi:hypothetical protein